MSLVYIDEVSVVTAVLGGFIILFGLVSFFVKERLYLSESLVSVIVGILLVNLKVFEPAKWGPRDSVSHDFMRIVIAIQVMCAGVALPRAYVIKEWKSLFVLLFPVMTFMWAISGLIFWFMIPNLNVLEALAIAACITPTDPILANSVIKGRFAEKHVPPHVRNLLSSESGLNDGFAYPFLYLSIYLLEEVSIGTSVGQWFLLAWLYHVILSIVIGIIVGYVARKLLYLAETNRLIDKESFLVFAIALALFLTGIVSIVGSNELLACFVAGTSFTWDDWFRKETEEAHLQEAIDMLLSLAVFVYVGAVVPWKEFQNSATEITVWRLMVCAILVLIFRRVPIVLALSRFIPAIKSYREAAFTGWFGPIGIGAIYYITVVRRHFEMDGHTNNNLYLTVEPVVYFMVLSSILVHGVTVPVVKISKRINTRTLTAGSINNQVSRLPVIRMGSELIFRPKTDKVEISLPEQSSKNMSSTTITVDPEIQIEESITSPEYEDQGNQEKQRDRSEEIGEGSHLDLPQNLIEKIIKKQKGSRSSKYAIWDEGDSFIIENYDGEDIYVIPNTQQEQNRNFFFRRKSTSTTSGISSGKSEESEKSELSGNSPPPQPEQSQSRIAGFFNRGRKEPPPNSQ